MYAERVAQDRNSAYKGRRHFGDTTVERLANLSTFIGHHKLVSDWQYSSAKVFAEIVRAASELQDNLKSITDVSRWKMDSLIVTGDDGSIKGMRKPRVNLGFRETSRGNLRLDWWVNEEDSDFTYRDRDFRHNPGYKDLSEVLFIRQFELMRVKVGRPPSGDLDIDLRPVMADIAVGLVEETIETIKSSFDVTLYTHFDLKRGNNGQLLEFGILSQEEAEAKATEEEMLRNERTANRLRNELYEWETTHGISAEIAVRAWEGMAAARMRIADRIAALTSLGATLTDDQAAFEKSLKRAKAVVVELGLELPEFNMSEIEGVTDRPDAVASRDAARATRLQDRIRKLVNPGTLMPPSYPSRTYEASVEELAEFGVGSVHEMVDQLNDRLRERNQFPVSTGDYPTNKAKFARLVRRWQASDVNESAEASPASSAPGMG